MGYLKGIIGFMLVGLFAFALLSFSIMLPSNNGANFSINSTESAQSTFNDLSVKLNKLQDETDAQKDVLETDEEVGVLQVILNSIRSIGTAFTGIYFSISNILFGFIVTTLFGSSSGIILGTLTSIMTIVIVLYAWKMFKSGDPN